MVNYKQVQAKFWQNDFVLGLTPEERYFYMYLITNTTTTLCGIYKFNLKLAVLETGFSAEVINRHLHTFENSKKIIISKTSKEIMIVNFMKHNFKTNKRIISGINSELKEVKDKELLRQFFEICKMRQYPTDEIFKGIILSSAVKEEGIDNAQDILQASKVQETSTEELSKDDTKDGANELKEPVKMLFTAAPTNSSAKKRRVKPNKKIEEIEVEFNDVIVEEDMEDAIKGTVVSAWNFTGSGGDVTFAAGS